MQLFNKSEIMRKTLVKELKSNSPKISSFIDELEKALNLKTWLNVSTIRNSNLKLMKIQMLCYNKLTNQADTKSAISKEYESKIF